MSIKKENLKDAAVLGSLNAAVGFVLIFIASRFFIDWDIIMCLCFSGGLFVGGFLAGLFKN